MKLISMTAIGALVAGAAHAGGMAPAPSEPIVMAPAPVMSGDDWTGGYAGVSVGYGVADADGIPELEGDEDFLDDDDDDDDFNIDIDGDGVIGGVYGGYQHDFGSYVLGAEADLNAANIDFDEDDLLGGDLSNPFDDDDELNGGAQIDAIHRLKLRAGYDAGSTLVYGVLGAAYADAEILGEDFSDTGYVVGAGVDYKMSSNMTVGGEVLYHSWDDFDDQGVDFEATTVAARVGYSF